MTAKIKPAPTTTSKSGPKSAERAERGTGGVNIAVVRGSCSSPADVRVLPSGQVLAQLQVTARLERATASVPVAVFDPPAWIEDLDTGDEVVVLGRIRRRFFQAAGITASRVELEAEVVAPATDRRRVAAVRKRIEHALDSLAS